MNETHGMRSQKSGVEIETKGLSLEGAARVIAQVLGGELWGNSWVTDPATGKVCKAVPDGSLHGVSAEIARRGRRLKSERLPPNRPPAFMAAGIPFSRAPRSDEKDVRRSLA